MDREISSIFNLGIGLITLSAVLFLVIAVAITGRHIGYNYLSVAEEMEVDLRNGDLNYLKENDIEMPAAAVLALVKANDDGINKLYLNYTGLYGKVSNDRLYDLNGKKTDTYRLFESHVSSKVRLYIEYNDSENGYDFYIHDIGCIKDVLDESHACVRK